MNTPEGANMPKINKIILFVLLTSSIKSNRSGTARLHIDNRHCIKVSRYTSCPYIPPTFIVRLLLILSLLSNTYFRKHVCSLNKRVLIRLWSYYSNLYVTNYYVPYLIWQRWCNAIYYGIDIENRYG